MRTKAFTTAAFAAVLGAGAALAQSQAPSTTAPSPSIPSKTPPSATAPSMTPSNGAVQYYSHQPSEMRASKLIGTNVVNSANETIGQINDIVLMPDGKATAAVIGVGGFLGIGERNVAVKIDNVKMSRDSSNNLVVTVNATKDQLKNAPAWQWDTSSGSGATTGAGSGTTGTTAPRK